MHGRRILPLLIALLAVALVPAAANARVIGASAVKTTRPSRSARAT